MCESGAPDQLCGGFRCALETFELRRDVRVQVAGTKYASSFRDVFGQRLRSRICLPCSTMPGWPQRYAMVADGSSDHTSLYFRITSSTRPVSPVHPSSV